MKNYLYKRGFIVPVLIGIIAVLIIGGGIYIYKNKKVEAPVDVNKNNLEILGNKEDLVSFSVKPGDIVSGVLNLEGIVKGAYFFEANIGIKLLDSDKNVFKSWYGTTTSNWMTIEPVPFTASIDSTGLNGQGYIEIAEDDPSDGEGGPAKKILIPVVFENEKEETITVKIYFHNFNLQKETDPNFIDCSKVFSINRSIKKNSSFINTTLEELLKGPSEKEKALGYTTAIENEIKVNNVFIDTKNILHIDFNKKISPAGGSCAVSEVDSQIRKTVTQFPEIEDIIITFNGVIDSFQP